MPKFSFKNKSQNEEKNRTLSLVLTDACNLQCSYCYENNSRQRENKMGFDVAKDAISEFLNREDEFKKVVVDFFGGEPLLMFPLIKRIVQWCLTQEWKKEIIFSIGTNGTLLNNEMKSWFVNHKEIIILGLSLDGNRKAHNINRSNSYDLVYPHLDFFKTNWPYQPAKMTISSGTIPLLAESVIDLEEMEMNFTANLPFEDIWGSPENKSVLLEMYREQLDLLVDYYTINNSLYPVYPLLGVIPDYLGIPMENIIDDNDCLRYCGAGHEMAVVDTDGSWYPCHRFLPWISGTQAPGVPINRQSYWKPEKCSNCSIVHTCPICAGYNWKENGDTGIRTTYHCEAHKLEVLAAARIGANRIASIPDDQLENMPPEERKTLKDRVFALSELIENGI